MSNSALILMISVQGSVTLITAYFLWKVLKTPTEEGKTKNDTGD